MKSERNRPLVGITLFSGREGHKRYTKVQYNYVESVIAAGGLPWLIPTLGDRDRVDDFAAELDALVLTGGEDLNPIVYRADSRPELGATDIARDRWEIDLLKACEARDIPVLGICRGIQVMNVARGGTLYQDIPAETGSAIGHAQFESPMENLHHAITIDKGSLMEEIFDTGELIVNSFHHQSVRESGTGLTVTARAADGIVEAMEDRSRRFYLGVQFHAEALPPLDREYLRIFSALIAATER